MAFAFAIPAIGSAVLPAIGTIGSGLGSALASGAGAIGSGLGALGGSIPIVGPALSGLGGAVGSLGSGLGGGLGALSAGNVGGALSSLGSGVLGAGSNMLGGLGGMYTGADKLLGGLLPNIGGSGITPSQGYLGDFINPKAIDPTNPFDVAAQHGGLFDDGTGLVSMGGNMGPMGMVDKIGALGALGQNFMGGGQQQPAYSAGSPSNQVQPVVINAGGGQAPAYQQLAVQPSGFIQPVPVEYNDQLSNDDEMSAQARSLRNFSGSRPTSLSL